MRLRMNAVLLARVSNHNAITMKVSGTMSVARIHHQYVMANKRPSGLKKTALKKDYRGRGKSESGTYLTGLIMTSRTWEVSTDQGNCGDRSGVALELHGDLDGEIAKSPVKLRKGPAPPQRDGLAETICL